LGKAIRRRCNLIRGSSLIPEEKVWGMLTSSLKHEPRPGLSIGPPNQERCDTNSNANELKANFSRPSGYKVIQLSFARSHNWRLAAGKLTRSSAVGMTFPPRNDWGSVIAYLYQAYLK
jgi:hypothetical protein